MVGVEIRRVRGAQRFGDRTAGTDREQGAPAVFADERQVLELRHGGTAVDEPDYGHLHRELRHGNIDLPVCDREFVGFSGAVGDFDGLSRGSKSDL